MAERLPASGGGWRLELRIALRYLAARRAAGFLSLITLIAVGGVFVGVTALLVVLAVMNGFEQDLREKILGTNAHLLILTRGNQPVRDYQRLMAEIDMDPRVVASAPFIYTETILDNGRAYGEGAVVRGIDPRREPLVTKVGETAALQALAEERARYPGIVLGYLLAERLAVVPGDTVIFSSIASSPLTPFGQLPRLSRLEVRGTMRTGIYEYDSKLAYISLETAQRLLGLDGAVTGVEVRLRDAFKAPEVGEALVARLGSPYRANNWIDLNRNLFSALKLEKTVMFVILTLIILVAAFNIITTLIMLVKEKTKEIGILRSMGLTSRAIMRIFMWQGLLIGLAGTLTGCGAGYLLAYLLDRYQFISLPGDVYFIDTLPISMEGSDFLLVGMASLLISFTATLYPALQAARLSPVEAIRHE